MLRKEIVYDALKRYTHTVDISMIRSGYNGASTNELSRLLEMDRTNCSRELNSLFNERLVLKVEGKPVRYFPVESIQNLFNTQVLEYSGKTLMDIVNRSEGKSNQFDDVIGANGSLRIPIDQAKAAMIYPPFGLHTLITGATGIGKTMFVDLMYNYAKTSGVLDKDAELVVFNCAEYADNPQLLVSELFGYVKGSFTGADSNKEGLVAKANNGILFLDEIHRLPSEGQEMLFQLMDAGKYHRLGDSKHEWNANVLIVGATTESIESSLLLTFVRRIPMLISLPSLDQRPLKEHLDLINVFFSEEQRKIKKDIIVDKDVLVSLLSYKYPGNIGQLKTDIQLICARSFLDTVTYKKDSMRVNKRYLPHYLLANIMGSDQRSVSIDTLLDSYGEKITYNGNTQIKTISYEDSFYEGIHDSLGIGEIKDYIQRMILRSYENRSESRHSPEEVLKIIRPEIYYSVEKALNIAESRLRCKYPHQTTIAFALHIQSTIERGLETKVLYNVSNDIKILHPNEYKVAKLVISYLSDSLNYDFALEEVLLATLFLATHHQKEETKVGLIVIAHGNGVARNMASVANELLETNHVIGLDLKLDENVQDFYIKFEESAKQANQGKGVIIIADMGSLTNFGTRFTEKTGIPSKTISFLSTPIVLESLRKVLFSNATLDTMYRELMDILESNVSHKSSQPIPKHIHTITNQQKAIVVTCMTGEGAAIALKNYMFDTLPQLTHQDIHVITANAQSDNQTFSKHYQICAVVGAIDLHLKDVPYITTEEILLGNGLKTLEFLVFKSIRDNGFLTTQRTDTILQILRDTLGFLNPDKALGLVIDAFSIIKDHYEITELDRLSINFSLHVPSMIERTIRMEEIPYQDIDKRIQKNLPLYNILRKALRAIEETYRVKVSDTEIGYLMDIFDTY